MLLTILCIWVGVSLVVAAGWSLAIGRLRHRRTSQRLAAGGRRRVAQSWFKGGRHVARTSRNVRPANPGPAR
jgi:hypothetical protein